MNWRDLSIVRKLGLLLAFNTALAVLSIALVFTLGSVFRLYQDHRDQLLALADVVGENSGAALAFGDPDTARKNLAALHAKREISAARLLVGPQDSVFAEVDFSTRHDHLDSLTHRLVDAVFPATLTVSHRIVDGDTTIGRIELETHLYYIWIDFLKNLGFMILIASGLAALAVHFGLRLRRIVTDPLLDLARVSNRVSRERNYALRATRIGNDEIGTLVDDFNHMLAEIQTRDAALRQEQESLELRVEQRTADMKLAKDEAERAERLLREERDLIAAGPSVVFKWAPTEDLPVTYVSPNVAAVFGYLPADLLAGRPPFAELIHPDDRARVTEEVAGHLRSGAANFQKHYRFRHADGNWRWIDDYTTVVRDARGVAQAIAGYVIDVTPRRHAEENLRLAASVFSHAREGIMITTMDGTLVEANEAFSRITGYGRDEALGRKPSMLKSGHHGPELYDRMWQTLGENGYWSGEIWNRRKDGEVYAAQLTISAVNDAGGEAHHYVALFSDITAQKEHQQQLEHIAHYDALTGLPNRVLLADRLRQALAQAKRRGQHLAVAYIDLDGFKAINDLHGHEAGDQLLVTLAQRMKQTLREGDTIARLGGDEFVAVLVDLQDIHACEPFFLRLLDATAQPVECHGLSLRVSASIGVSFDTPTEDSDADQLLRHADHAMYQAKLAGKNRYHVFDAEQDRNARGRHESIEHIRQALADRQFVLYYQPQVNLRLGTMIGAEALIRWQDPDHGLLPPAAFLPNIEGHPLSVEIGEWVIDTALAQIETWQARGLNLPVSVNIAAHHLQQTDFVERLRTLLAAHPAVRPDRLELEVLETSALIDIGHVSAVIGACAQMGVSFALDDFGTGYSSLTYLKRLPARALKIDQSFVRDMLDDPDDLAIMEGVLGLAAAFNLAAVAEGVETVAHGETLLRLGCELAQGYGIARPMPAADLPGWQAGWQPDPLWSQTPRLGRDHLPVLFAGSEHRAWIRALGEHLDGLRDAPPPLKHNQCRFGQWLDSSRERRQPRHADIFADIEALHRQVHEQGIDLIGLRSHGRNTEAHAGLDGLHQLRDDLLAQLRHLLIKA